MKTFSYLEVLYSITDQIRREYLTARMTKICLVDLYKIPRSGSVLASISNQVVFQRLPTGHTLSGAGLGVFEMCFHVGTPC